jgi:hypothetical protein
MSRSVSHPDGLLDPVPPVVVYARQVAARVRAWSALTVEVDFEEPAAGTPMWPLCEACGEPRHTSPPTGIVTGPPVGPLVLARSPAWAEVICRELRTNHEGARRRLAEIHDDLDRLVMLVARRTLDEGEFTRARTLLREERWAIALEHLRAGCVRRRWTAEEIESFAGPLRARAVQEAAAIVAQSGAWSGSAASPTDGGA